ncbi:hypothetical protein Tco_0067518 [Tanacetum coccineum]
MSGYDEMEQNILNFNDLFPFNKIYPDDLKSDKGNDDNEIDMIQSSWGRFKESPDRYFPAQSVGSSNTDVLDLPCLLVLITGTSQSRQHGKSESDSYYLSDYVVNSFTGPLSISS